jgi:futalosine hydrolase
MNCLLVAATTKEIAPFLDRYRADAGNTQVDVLITGVGLTATTYSLAKQVGLKKPDLVIQAGIAGFFY